MKKIAVLFLSFFPIICCASEYNLLIGIYSDANNKPQEDTSAVIHKNGSTFLGVFDGHGGWETAFILKRDFPQFFFESLERKSFSGEKQKIKNALFESLEKIENHVLEACADGSTATVAVINKKCLHVAQVGDSSLILEGNDKVQFNTQPHDLADENGSEFKRVLDANGTIYRFIIVESKTKELKQQLTWRINGLEMTRSIGDATSKGMGQKNLLQNKRVYNTGVEAIYEVYPDNKTETLRVNPQVGQVIATPDYTKIKLTDSNRWLIVATDGFSDFVKHEDAISWLREYHQEGKSAQQIAKLLVDHAIKLGSKDNVTVIVHDLQAQAK